MTDNDIVKAFEWCTGETSYKCRECPLEYEAFCKEKMEEAVLDLINRQKAEIERLKEAYAVYEETTGLKWARGEAIKEFAGRLKESQIKCYLPLLGLSSRTEIEDYFNEILMQVRDAIDNLVKEMTEDAKHD